MPDKVAAALSSRTSGPGTQNLDKQQYVRHKANKEAADQAWQKPCDDLGLAADCQCLAVFRHNHHSAINDVAISHQVWQVGLLHTGEFCPSSWKTSGQMNQKQHAFKKGFNHCRVAPQTCKEHVSAGGL
jgi:hypothetical protein